MQTLGNLCVSAPTFLAFLPVIREDEYSEYETDPEDLESPREFPAQNVPCPLVGRLKTLATKFMPPPPPRWVRTLFVIWIAWCGVARSAAPWVMGRDRVQGAIDAFKMLTG